MDVVLVMFRDGKRKEFPVTVPTFRLGRHPQNDLRIPTRDVSRRHCELLVQDDRLVVRDVGSTNGTYVNGKQVEEVTLKPGDRLTIGPVTFVVQIDGKPADIEPFDSVAPKAAAASKDDTEDLLVLDDVDLEEDPISAVEAVLDEEEDEDEKTV